MKHESITLTLYTDPERCTTNYVALQMERHTLQTDNIMMTWCQGQKQLECVTNNAHLMFPTVWWVVRHLLNNYNLQYYNKTVLSGNVSAKMKMFLCNTNKLLLLCHVQWLFEYALYMNFSHILSKYPNFVTMVTAVNQ